MDRRGAVAQATASWWFRYKKTLIGKRFFVVLTEKYLFLEKRDGNDYNRAEKGGVVWDYPLSWRCLRGRWICSCT